MDNSYSKPTETHCPHCNQMVTVDIRLIVDQSTQPDLIQNMIEGSFKTHICPNCTQHIPEADQPLLIYRLGKQPLLLFASALKIALAEDQTHTLQQLVQYLLISLESSDDEWVREGLKRVRWHQLPIILSEAT